MNKIDTAWIAGWLEGEGSFLSYTSKRGYTRLIIRAVSNDLDTVQQAQRRTGLGVINGPYSYGGRQPSWHWVVARRAEAQSLMIVLRPWMSIRRQAQIDAALEIGAQ